MKEYDGYMQTYIGTKFYPANPTPDTIFLEDIAHALSNICRYSGHSKYFYSVAEHCNVMAKLFPSYAGLALFHDCAEAYMGDIPRPVKALLPEYRLMENKILRVVFDMAGLVLNRESLEIIEYMDNVMLSHERRSIDIMQNREDISWGPAIDSIDDGVYPFRCYDPNIVEDLYLKALKDYLRGKDEQIKQF